MLKTLDSRYQERGAYSLVGKTGTMAAGLAAASPIFSFRWATATANAKAVIDRIALSVASLGTGFTAGVGYIDAVVARAFSKPDHGGAAAPAMTSVTPAESGGTLAAGTYYYAVSAIGPWGESALSAEGNGTIVGSEGKNTVAYGSVTGATGYRIYKGVETGVYTEYFEDDASTFVDTGVAGTAGTHGTSDAIGGLTLTTNNAKRRTAMDPTLLSSARLSQTATLVAGTRTLDAQAFAAEQFGVSTATNTVHLATKDIWKPDPETYPLVLAAEEGFILRATVPATGTWQGVVTVDWREVLG